jgi:hypothetical protein
MRFTLLKIIDFLGFLKIIDASMGRTRIKVLVSSINFLTITGALVLRQITMVVRASGSAVLAGGSYTPTWVERTGRRAPASNVA